MPRGLGCARGTIQTYCFGRARGSARGGLRGGPDPRQVQNGGVDDPSERRVRPEWSRPRAIGLVFAGGVLGAGARELLESAVPQNNPVPVAILIANILGAFLLGLLLESLGRAQNTRASSTRLLLGTGLLGGFTTYSMLALGVVRLAVDGRPGIAALYGVGAVVLGAIMTWAGIVLGAARGRLLGRARDRGSNAGGPDV